jgi:hypothetical protein
MGSWQSYPASFSMAGFGLLRSGGFGWKRDYPVTGGLIKKRTLTRWRRLAESGMAGLEQARPKAAVRMTPAFSRCRPKSDIRGGC